MLWENSAKHFCQTNVIIFGSHDKETDRCLNQLTMVTIVDPVLAYLQNTKNNITKTTYHTLMTLSSADPDRKYRPSTSMVDLPYAFLYPENCSNDTFVE